jgi:aspartyl aminopeptidase
MSSNLGIRTVDIGNPMLSMHSIRETCGTIDIVHSCNLFIAFFNDFRKLDDSFDVDNFDE